MVKPLVSVSMAFVRGMLHGAERRGMPVEPLLAEAGIDPALLSETSARVTGEQYVAMFRLLVQRLEDDGLGFYSRPLRPGSFRLIVQTALGAPTLEIAMRRMARTFRLLQDDVQMVLAREGRLAGWQLHFAGDARAQPTFMHEMLLRIYWLLMGWLIARRLPAVRFDLAFEAPPYAGSYRNVLPAPIHFGQPHSAFWIDAKALDEPVRRDMKALQAFMTDVQWNIVLPRRKDDDVVARVRLLLQDSGPTWPALAETAEALHMSVSTLQRHLAAEGTTFQALKDDLRRDLAISRLIASPVPLSQLASELGFSDSAAFQRAFKSWTGSPPGAYRRKSAPGARS